LTVAPAEPASEDIVDRLRLATGMQVRTVQATREFIREQLDGIYPSNRTPARQAVHPSDEAPAIRALYRIHERTILAHASDLHVEPTPVGGRVRQRIDGICTKFKCSMRVFLRRSLLA